MSVFEAKHVSKKYGENQVLRDISMSVEKGEVVAIIGPSGSGKTTFLRCATLLEQIDGGSLQYDDLRIASLDENGNAVYASHSILAQAKEKIGMVFQNYNLFPHYSVLKNIMDAPITVQGKSKKEARKIALKLIVRMGLHGRRDAYPYELSGGQQQRVSIARALA